MALFKIFNNFNSNTAISNSNITHVAGYCYFDKTTNKFYIDTSNDANGLRQLNGTYYGVCNTASGTAIKTVTIPGFGLTTGVSVLIKFANTNTAGVSSLQLNINGTGAKDIVRFNSDNSAISLSKADDIIAGSICQFVYDGTYWVWVGHIDTVQPDIKLRQILTSNNNNYPLLLSNVNNSESTVNVDNTAWRNNSIYANPSTGTITATNFNGKINNHTVNADVPSDAKFTDTTYGVVTNGGLEMSGNNFKIKNSGVTNTMLQNSSMTIAGNAVSLGGTLSTATLKTALGITGAMSFIGKATVDITDESTTNPQISGYTFSQATAGDVIIDKNGEYEYVWDGTKWERLGGDGSYVLKNTTVTFTPKGTIPAHTYTPAGNVSQPIFTGTEATISVTGSTSSVSVANHSYKPEGTISEATSGNATYTPRGTVSQPTFTGSTGNVSVSGTPTGSVAVKVQNYSGSETPANVYTPTGNVTSSFTGTSTTSTGKFTPTGSVSVTPSITLNTTNINSVTNAGTVPSLTMTVDDNETLTWTWDAGTVPTTASTSVATSVKTQTASASFSGNEGNISVAGVPNGTVSSSFTGGKSQFTATFSGSSTTSTGTFTPSGSVSQPSFTGTGAPLIFTGKNATITHSVTQGSVSGTATYTPAGTVSKPSFTGTQATLSHTFNGAEETITIS